MRPSPAAPGAAEIRAVQESLFSALCRNSSLDFVPLGIVLLPCNIAVPDGEL